MSHFTNKFFLQLKSALTFYTIFPVKDSFEISDQSLKNIHSFLPIIGVLISITTYCFYLSVNSVFPNSIGLLFLIFLPTMLTRAFHEDGLADFTDGIFGGFHKEKRLSIMKDSNIGVFGVIALIFYYFFIYHFYEILVLQNKAHIGLFCCHAISRIYCLIPTLRIPYVRISKKILSNNKMELNNIFWVSSFLILILVFLWIPLYSCTLIGILLILYYIIFEKLLIKSIEGYTGDCLGALQKTCELIILMVLTI